MPLRIGFDLDGVLADLHGALLQEARRLFDLPDAALLASADEGEPPDVDATPAADSDAAEKVAAAGSLPLSSSKMRRLWHEVRAVENFWETLAEIEPGAVRRLGEVTRARRWEVLFLTSRPATAGDPVQVQSQRWLERHGFSLPAVWVGSTSRGKIADALALDVVIDDRPENCLDVRIESRASPILIWRTTEAAIPASARKLGIGSAPTAAACLSLLEQADDARSSDAPVLERVKKLFGFGSRSTSPGAEV